MKCLYSWDSELRIAKDRERRRVVAPVHKSVEKAMKGHHRTLELVRHGPAAPNHADPTDEGYERTHAGTERGFLSEIPFGHLGEIFVLEPRRVCESSNQ